MATKNPKKHKLSLFKNPALFVLIGCIGIALVIGSNFYLAYKRWQYSFAVTPPITSLAVESELPINIRLPQIDISLPVTEGDISNGVWLVSNTGATHLIRSSTPGSLGNIVIYGHNTNAIFGRLNLIQKGHTVLLTTKDGKIHRYIVSNLLTVPPSRVDLVLPTKTEVLTVYTCTGFLDSERLVIQAIPEAGT